MRSLMLWGIWKLQRMGVDMKGIWEALRVLSDEHAVVYVGGMVSFWVLGISALFYVGVVQPIIIGVMILAVMVGFIASFARYLYKGLKDGN